MPIDRSSDSLSRCDPSLYSSFYDVRKKPEIKSPSELNKKVEVTTGSTDTIEVSLSKDHLKKEALNRLRRPAKYMIAQQGFMRIGNYLFLAVTLPPYLLLYGLPKWIIVEALPALFIPLLKAVKTAGAKIKKPLQMIQKRWVQLLHAIQHIGLGLIQPVIRLMSDMRQGIRRLQEKMHLFFKKAQEGVLTAFLLPGVKIKEGIKQVQKKITAWAEKIGRTSQTLLERVQEGLQVVKEVPLQFLGWGQAQLQRLNQYTLVWKKSWGQQLQRSQHLTEQAMGWMVKQSRQIAKKITVSLQPFITFYREKWQPRWNQFKQTFQRKWKEESHAFHQKHQKMLQRLKERQEKLKGLSYVQALERLFSKGWFSRLPRLLQEGLKRWFFHPLMRGGGERCVQFYSWIVGQFFALPSRCSSLGLQSMQVLSKSLQAMTNALRLGGQKGNQLLQSGQQTGFRWVWLSTYYILLSLTMGGMLFAAAMESAKTITLSLLAKFSFNRRQGK